MAELDTPSGMRDFLPEQMQRREYVIETIKAVFRQWGFLPLETPSMERWDTLKGKYGEEGEKLIYHCFNSGNLPAEPGAQLTFSREERPDLALRYDLTVPLARVMAMFGHKLPKPFKRYQIQPVWRGDRPGAGRFREFWQCDVDVIGSLSPLVEVELIAVTHECLTRLGFQDFRIRLNHRQVLLGLIEAVGLDPALEGTVLTAIDKLDKLPPGKVHRELVAKGIDSSVATQLLDLVLLQGTSAEILAVAQEKLAVSAQAQAGLTQISWILAQLAQMGLPEAHYTFDLTLARGLDYYTGMIFETVTKADIGSIGGGGRYDHLIQTLSGGKVDLPAAGTSLGLDRLITAMELLDLFAQRPIPTKVLVTYFTDPELACLSLQLAAQIRAQGLDCELFYGEEAFNPNALRKQLGYADKRSCTHVLILGPEEYSRGEVVLRVMRSRQQEAVPISGVVDRLNALI